MLEQIKAIRRQQKITQAEMGKKLGVRRDTYSSYESGNMAIRLGQVETVLHVLGVRSLLVTEDEFQAITHLRSDPEMAKCWREYCETVLESQRSQEKLSAIIGINKKPKSK